MGCESKCEDQHANLVCHSSTRSPHTLLLGHKATNASIAFKVPELNPLDPFSQSFAVQRSNVHLVLQLHNAVASKF